MFSCFLLFMKTKVYSRSFLVAKYNSSASINPVCADRLYRVPIESEFSEVGLKTGIGFKVHIWIIDNKSRILCVGIVSIRLLAVLIEFISIDVFWNISRCNSFGPRWRKTCKPITAITVSSHTINSLQNEM